MENKKLKSSFCSGLFSRKRDLLLKLAASLVLTWLVMLGQAFAELTCVEGVQDSGSIYRICTPPENYNGNLIVWAHGFQDAGKPLAIPEDQLQFDDIYLPELVIGLGFAFATNSYSKTGLAVFEGMDDILDLVTIYVDHYGQPENVFLVGASEGGLITALLAEQNPDVFDAALALCGPIGDFPLQINYLGDARVTFEYFFPNQIPGYDIFNNDSEMPDEEWEDYFNGTIFPLLRDNPWKAKQWFKVAKLPYDPENYFDTIINSAKDVLRYSVINLPNAVAVLGGQPFDNRWKWYTGSLNDFRLNLRVKRLTPDAAAIAEMKMNYNTSGSLDIPLISMHTLRDQQVPYWHETLYSLKTIAEGSFLTRHVNIPVDRYGHCNFTREEALGGFALMLLYAGDWEMLSALETSMP